MKITNLPLHTRNNQRGTVLIIAMSFLLILTLLGLSSMESTMLETKLAANSKERNVALQVAEIGLLQSRLLLTDPSRADELAELMQKGVLPGTSVPDIVMDHERGISVKTTITGVNYKGRFKQKRNMGRQAHSHTKIQYVYFEMRSKGQSAGDLQNPSHTELRMGVRQATPKI
ncbi:MAG: hypothetical protein DRQ49_16370 [Gammaproteobacteria bacterium]|nr:MAG: hypothetical protein DRQ49_16370 [Gammaproteobacteria bacterium]RKZ38240.1 MAG: hypothetical protein DRQ41_12355 [Gammaproteobacteria bacterium]RKZ74795.1 MAG: hypothetical protein DRQ57_09720 [Gammaproteobacteria bacterium]